MNTKTSRNSDKTVIVANGFALIAMISYAALPVFLGAYVDTLDYTLTTAGRMASAETISHGFGCILATFLCVRKGWNLRLTVTVCLVVLMLAQFLSAHADNANFLLVARALSGFSCAIIYLSVSAYISSLADPDRSYALFYGTLFVAGSIGLFLVPQVLDIIGLTGVYLIYAVLIGSSLFFVRLFPAFREESREDKENTSIDSASLPLLVIALILLALVINFVFNGGMWIYAERIGALTESTPQLRGLLLAVAMLLGLIGTGLAWFFSNRWGRLIPIGIGHLLLLISAGWLMLDPSIWEFFVAVACLNIGVTIMTPYYLGALASIDKSGRAATWGTLAFIFGYAWGTPAMSLLVGDSGFQDALAIVIMGFIISFALTCLGFYLYNREELALIDAQST